MSVMCVSDKHIDLIVTAYLKYVTKVDDSFNYQLAGNRISRILLRINIRAFNQRYNEVDGFEFICNHIHKEDKTLFNEPLQVLKAVQCYFYQVDEYLQKPLNVDLEDVKFVKAFCQDLTFNMVTRLEGYNLAKWCID